MRDCAGCDAWHDGKCVYMADVYGRSLFECSSGNHPAACVYSCAYDSFE